MLKKLTAPFYNFSMLVIRRLGLGQREQMKQAEEQLASLYYGKQRVTAEEYYARTLAMILALLFWGGGAILFWQLALGSSVQEALFHQIRRPDYGQGDRMTELEVQLEGETDRSVISIKVSERQYTKEEIQAVFKEIMEDLETEILGENSSLDEVRKDLSLPQTSQGGAVKVEWIIQPADIMDSSGSILREPEDEGELIELRALLKYREEEAEYTCFARVLPGIKTADEEQQELLIAEVAKADEAGVYKEVLELPDTLAGKEISWTTAGPDVAAVLGGILLIAVVCLFVKRKKELETKTEERRKQLILDYPDLLFKINMLLGAGMTIQAAFIKIGGEYRKRGGELRYVYEEVILTCQEIKNGVGEAAAYMNFGKRCQESRYVKLGSILSQNLKKGNKDLREILEQEAFAGMEERRNTARKLGEEAGTKLLLPMILMLLIVLVILLIPAVMAF